MHRDRPGYLRPNAWAIVLFCLAAVAWVPNASAQLRTAIIEPSGADPELAGALERVIRTRMSELGVGGGIESSPLAWSDLELAAGCMGEDTECYAEVAAQLGVDELVLSRLDASTEDCLVELARWRAGHLERRLVHERGRNASFEVLRGVEPALRALYGLPQGGPVEVELAPAPSRRPDLAGPIAVSGLGLAALGSAIVLSVAADASRAAWQTGETMTVPDVDLTLDARQRAESERIAADVLFATAAVAGVVAVVWLITELTGDDAELDVAALSTRWSL